MCKGRGTHGTHMKWVMAYSKSAMIWLYHKDLLYLYSRDTWHTYDLWTIHVMMYRTHIMWVTSHIYMRPDLTSTHREATYYVAVSYGSITSLLYWHMAYLWVMEHSWYDSRHTYVVSHVTRIHEMRPEQHAKTSHRPLPILKAVYPLPLPILKAVYPLSFFDRSLLHGSFIELFYRAF